MTCLKVNKLLGFKISADQQRRKRQETGFFMACWYVEYEYDALSCSRKKVELGVINGSHWWEIKLHDIFTFVKKISLLKKAYAKLPN